MTYDMFFQVNLTILKYNLFYICSIPKNCNYKKSNPSYNCWKAKHVTILQFNCSNKEIKKVKDHNQELFNPFHFHNFIWKTSSS